MGIVGGRQNSLYPLVVDGSIDGASEVSLDLRE